MINSEMDRLNLYIKFQNGFKLDQRLEKIFDFKFGSAEYWRVCSSYIDFIDGKNKNNLFSYYCCRLNKEIMHLLSR